MAQRISKDFSKDLKGSQRISKDLRELPRIAKNLKGSRRICKDLQGIPRISMALEGSQRISKDLKGFQKEFKECRRIDLKGPQRISKDLKGSQRVSKDCKESQSISKDLFEPFPDHPDDFPTIPKPSPIYLQTISICPPSFPRGGPSGWEPLWKEPLGGFPPASPLAYRTAAAWNESFPSTLTNSAKRL
jgi:hypothetical protein